MDMDTINEITEQINEIKLLLAKGDFSKHIVDMYEAKIKALEAEINFLEFW